MIGEIDPTTLVDEAYYKCYPTKVHRDKDSPWFFNGRHLREVLRLYEEYTNSLMWGNGTK